MATLGAENSIIEMAKNIAPDGSQMTIAMTMAREMPIFLDIPWFPSNDAWMHKSLQSAKLSTGTWRGTNEYVPSGKTLTREQYDVIGIIEDFASYDKLWIDRQPDPNKARLGRAKMHIEGMSQEVCSAFLYGNNKINPKKPHGFAPRLNALGRYVLGCSGTGSDLSSLYIVTWGEGCVYGVFPKNGTAPGGEFPVMHKSTTGPEGRVDTDSSGNKLIVYEDNFKFEGGIVVEDPRCLGRVCNIETAGTTNILSSSVVSEVIGRMKVTEKTVIYANETIITQMRNLMNAKVNVYFEPGKGAGLFGEPVLYFDTIPIRKIDSSILLNTESALS